MVHMAVTILVREAEITARKTLEELWIAFKNPAINRKEECVTLTLELPSIADLYELDHGR